MAHKWPYPVQLVQPDGRRVLDPEYSSLVADVDGSALRALYQDMVITRRLDAEATALQRQGQLGLWAPSRGQEASQVGSAHALRADDFAFTSYREHGVVYCRGVDPAAVTPLWRGTALSGWDPYAHNVTNPNIVVGSQALHAVGWAYGAHLEGSESGAIVYFGDGASSQGDIAEALVFASTWAAPVVFFCQNNHWAISVPVKTQSATPISQRATGYGIPNVQVDGNDVLAVLAVTRKAMAHVHEGSGPFFIEALTYRMGPHTTSDDPTRYRTDAELEVWANRDPIDRLRRLLTREDHFSDEFDATVTAKADAVAARVRMSALADKTPEPSTMFDNVYATPHHSLAAEKAAFEQFVNEVA